MSAPTITCTYNGNSNAKLTCNWKKVSTHNISLQLADGVGGTTTADSTGYQFTLTAPVNYSQAITIMPFASLDGTYPTLLSFTIQPSGQTFVTADSAHWTPINVSSITGFHFNCATTPTIYQVASGFVGWKLEMGDLYMPRLYWDGVLFNDPTMPNSTYSTGSQQGLCYFTNNTFLNDVQGSVNIDVVCTCAPMLSYGYGGDIPAGATNLNTIPYYYDVSGSVPPYGINQWYMSPHTITQPIILQSAPYNDDNTAGTIDFKFKHQYTYEQACSHLGTPPPNTYNLSPWSTYLTPGTNYPKQVYQPDTPYTVLGGQYDLTPAVTNHNSVVNGATTMVAYAPTLALTAGGSPINSNFWPNRYCNVIFYDDDIKEWITVDSITGGTDRNVNYYYNVFYSDTMSSYMGYTKPSHPPIGSGVAGNVLPFSGWCSQNVSHSGTTTNVGINTPWSAFQLNIPIIVMVYIQRNEINLGNSNSINVIPQGTVGADIITAISFPSGNNNPVLHAVINQCQVKMASTKDWTVVATFPDSDHQSLITCNIPITYYNQAVKYIMSIDLGATWSIGKDLQVKHTDGTAITDNMAPGAEVWQVQFMGAYINNQFTLTFNKVTQPTFPDSYAYKYPRCTSLQVLPDGSIYANGVMGDPINLPTGDNPDYDVLRAEFLAAEQWLNGKRSISSIGKTWTDTTTLNTNLEITAYYPIWASRGCGHGNRGGGGANTGLQQLMFTGIDDNLYVSQDGNTWTDTGKVGGAPSQSTLWYTKGGSSDGAAMSYNDFTTGAYPPADLLVDSLHPITYSDFITYVGGVYPYSYPNLTSMWGVPWYPNVARAQDFVYGSFNHPGWCWDTRQIAIVNLYDEGDNSPIQLMCFSTNYGKTWTILHYSQDGGKTWVGNGGCPPGTSPPNLNIVPWLWS